MPNICALLRSSADPNRPRQRPWVELRRQFPCSSRLHSGICRWSAILHPEHLYVKHFHLFQEHGEALVHLLACFFLLLFGPYQDCPIWQSLFLINSRMHPAHRTLCDG